MKKQSSYDIGFHVGMMKTALGMEDLKNAWHWFRKPENAWARTALGGLGGAGLGGMMGGTRGAVLGGLGGAGLGYAAPDIKDFLYNAYAHKPKVPDADTEQQELYRRLEAEGVPISPHQRAALETTLRHSNERLARLAPKSPQAFEAFKQLNTTAGPVRPKTFGESYNEMYFEPAGKAWDKYVAGPASLLWHWATQESPEARTRREIRDLVAEMRAAREALGR